jgi:hypothetical protein
MSFVEAALGRHLLCFLSRWSGDSTPKSIFQQPLEKMAVTCIANHT